MFGLTRGAPSWRYPASYKSASVIQLSSDPVLMLRSKLATGEVIHPITGASQTDGFGWISYNWSGDASLTSNALAHTCQDTFRFTLNDASVDSNLIDLNGLPLTLVLLFYKHDDVSSLQRRSLLLQHMEQLPGV
jgi:hypothetical protein